MARFARLEFTEEEVLAALCANDGNQRRAAEALGVSQGWVAKWLNRRGYEPKVYWVKREQQPA